MRQVEERVMSHCKRLAVPTMQTDAWTDFAVRGDDFPQRVYHDMRVEEVRIIGACFLEPSE